MKESGFWRKLRPLMREAAPGIVVERIESWSTPGFPDVSGTWEGVDFWLELKIIRGLQVKFQPGQVPWLRRRWRAGSRCFVLAYEPGDWRALLFDGDRAKELSNNHVDEVTTRWMPSLDTIGIRRMLKEICSNDKV
ncbi:MAG: hypothetical protein V3S55_07775 [Nitrospiraceae bacterium]